jgi:hypothetical protein
MELILSTKPNCHLLRNVRGETAAEVAFKHRHFEVELQLKEYAQKQIQNVKEQLNKTRQEQSKQLRGQQNNLHDEQTNEIEEINQLNEYDYPEPFYQQLIEIMENEKRPQQHHQQQQQQQQQQQSPQPLQHSNHFKQTIIQPKPQYASNFFSPSVAPTNQTGGGNILTNNNNSIEFSYQIQPPQRLPLYPHSISPSQLQNIREGIQSQQRNKNEDFKQNQMQKYQQQRFQPRNNSNQQNQQQQMNEKENNQLSSQKLRLDISASVDLQYASDVAFVQHLLTMLNKNQQ